MNKTLIIGITGASGSIYSLNFLKHASAIGLNIKLVATATGAAVFKYETGSELAETVSAMNSSGGSIKLYDNSDMFADIASGSSKSDGMVIVPCSMKTLSGVANGYSTSLLERAADVTLKERRPLILTVRETPLSLIHLRNMTLAAEAGAVILPAAPGFYHRPLTLDDIADFITGKILDHLEIEHNLKTSWK